MTSDLIYYFKKIFIMTPNIDKMENDIPYFECECTCDKKYCLIFDGGDSENYAVEYCQNCFDNDDKQFLLSKEVIL